jgi:hypothetical protein
LTLRDNQKSGIKKKMLANLRAQGDHHFATGCRFAL